MLTARAQRVYDLIVGKPGISRISGLTDPRPIAGTATTSEHTYGNALDIYGTKDALLFWAAQLDKTRGDYDIKVLCYDPGFGRKYDVCTTKHTDHIHVDFGPHCGGVVPTSGTPNERVTSCNAHQGGGVPGSVYPEGSAGRTAEEFLDIDSLVTKVLIVGIGVVMVGAGIVLLVKDTGVGKTVVSAATKGIL